MKHRRMVAALALAAACATLWTSSRPARAALAEGQPAPLFATQATLGENVFTFDLAQALKKGPVVLYFYPQAFTEGCTQEAHDFAENIDSFKKLGATVIGISKDDIATLKRFGTSECRSKFSVASDEGLKIAKRYDATLTFSGDFYANRISYVIAPNDKIVYVYSSLDPDKHVANTLDALRKLKRAP
jgi:peroxiredoxin Q/BCP